MGAHREKHYCKLCGRVSWSRRSATYGICAPCFEYVSALYEVLETMKAAVVESFLPKEEMI